MKEIFLKTEDNIKIAINYINNENESVVIICPGWFMTKDSGAFLKMSNDLSKYFDIITMDFRGHGKSSGFYTFSAKEESDLKTVIDYVKSNNYEQIHLLGFSLGGALVLLQGEKTSNEISKIITVSAPSEFYKIENRMYSPDAWIPTLFHKFEPRRWLTIRAGNPFLKKRKPVDIIQNIKCPTLFIAGEKDPTVLPWHTKKLHDKATCRKAYKLFSKTRHAEDIYLDYPEEFIKTCVNWLKD